MKLKNTLSVVIGSLVAASSIGALAQGQGAVEVEAFGKRYFADSVHDITNGNLFGGSVGYFLTDDVSLNLSHGVYKSLEGDNAANNGGAIDGHLTALEAAYHFGVPGVRSLRPYVSAGFAHQELDNTSSRGQNKSTLATVGSGVKYYVSENVLLKAGLDLMHGLDQEQTEWMAGFGVGMNFGGGSRPAPAPAPVAVAPVEQPAPVAEQPVPEVVRVELDVKFDFDKAQVKPESFADIQNLAEFMNQYPQTTTTVEGHTDSVGTDAYNQKLSERRAAAVREVLVNQYGVSSSRVSSVGYGESRPVADNATEAGRAINRRVEAEVEAQIQR
ncbi:OmpA family protein [Pseudomonas stutzeri]|nr:OmpA family protein [Stutzerimonas stutzeri]